MEEGIHQCRCSRLPWEVSKNMTSRVTFYYGDIITSFPTTPSWISLRQEGAVGCARGRRVTLSVPSSPFEALITSLPFRINVCFFRGTPSSSFLTLAGFASSIFRSPAFTPVCDRRSHLTCNRRQRAAAVSAPSEVFVGMLGCCSLSMYVSRSVCALCFVCAAIRGATQLGPASMNISASFSIDHRSFRIQKGLSGRPILLRSSGV